MQEMHRPYRRIIPGAKTAVLMIHGLLSTPRFFDDFVAATPEGISVCSMLLPGHGGSVPDFGRVRWGAWRAAVAQALAELTATHERVYILAHSLGTLLAINAPGADRAAGMLLIAVPLRLHIRLSAMAGNILKGVGLGEDPATLATYYGTAQDARVWRYVTWLPRYAELFAEMAAARRALPTQTVPAGVFMCGRDELVSRRSCDLLAGCPCVRLTMLAESAHHAFVPEEKEQLLAAYQQMTTG